MLYSDDLAGNQSKKWHKLDCWCALLAGLPKDKNTKLENIHLLSCSDHAACLDMAVSITDELIQLETSGIEVYDGFLKKDILVMSLVLCIICDNPQASEICSHLGSSVRKFYRMCLVSVRPSHDSIFTVSLG